MNDCCRANLEKAKWISRATWICPVCGKDVTISYLFLQEAIRDEDERV